MFEEVNEEILDGDDRLHILNKIRGFSIKNFNNTFINSVEEVLESRGKISSKQYNALVNIYETFKSG